MSGGEQTFVDAAGDFLSVVEDGERVPDPGWRSCRVVLTSERLVLSTNGGDRSIPLAAVSLLDDAPGEYGDGTPLRVGDSLVLVDAQGVDDFGREYCRAALYDEVILAKHPAKVGGVVQDGAEWSKARFRLVDGRVTLGLPGNRTVSFPVDDVGTVDVESRRVLDEKRQVIAIEHAEDGRSVETYLSGTTRHTRTLESLLGGVLDEREAETELSELEKQAVMALYSGVSPFEMAEFLGIDVGEVEELYASLLDAGVVDKVRERTEVTLNAHGRNVASETMSER